MTSYTIDQLNRLKLKELKAIANERGLVPTGDKRKKTTWVGCIAGTKAFARGHVRMPDTTPKKVTMRELKKFARQNNMKLDPRFSVRKKLSWAMAIAHHFKYALTANQILSYTDIVALKNDLFHGIEA